MSSLQFIQVHLLFNYYTNYLYICQWYLLYFLTIFYFIFRVTQIGLFPCFFIIVIVNSSIKLHRYEKAKKEMLEYQITKQNMDKLFQTEQKNKN